MVDHLELLEVTIDNSLNFSKHIGKILKKVGDVLRRLKNTLLISSTICLYNSFVMYYFTCCSVIGRRGGLMVSALDSGASGPDSSSGRGHCVVFLGKTLYSHDASLYPGV